MAETHESDCTANAKWMLFAVLYKSAGFARIVNQVVEVTSFDPYAMLDSVSGDVIAFTFYRRLVADVHLDGKTYRAKSDWQTPEGGPRVFYFINVRKLSSLKALTRFWRTSRRDFAKLNAMSKRGSNHVVSWKHGIDLGYDPELDILLTR